MGKAKEGEPAILVRRLVSGGRPSRINPTLLRDHSDVKVLHETYTKYIYIQLKYKDTYHSTIASTTRSNLFSCTAQHEQKK
jgi:hypothetical protein